MVVTPVKPTLFLTTMALVVMVVNSSESLLQAQLFLSTESMERAAHLALALALTLAGINLTNLSCKT